MHLLLFKIALIGVAGIGAQWAAWRLRIPGIALLLVTGFILGPATGFLNPEETLGDLYRPAISLAVAIILFEGGLTLNFKEISETSVGVRRIVLAGGPLVWAFSTLAAHYGAGLSWPTSFVLGGILIVTGPTVIIPLLRQAQLGQRPASLLRWEAIVNDPIGALCAVFAFEIYFIIYGAHDGYAFIGFAVLAAIIAIGGGYVFARLIILSFIRGYVPEYLKAPVLFTCVLFAFAVSDLVLEESGLMTVTVMGITIANSRLASLTEMRRFKETVTILLVSGLFILLTASLTLQQLADLGWSAVIFAALILFAVRPAAIMLATIGAGLSIKERLLVSWIAPRGIVAVAVSGLFGQALAANGVEDGSQMTALAFVIVASTIVLHGFSLKPLAGLLDLKSATRPGVLFIGGSTWSIAFAEKLQELDVPVLIADSNWNHIREARLADVPVHYGEILSEAAHHAISFNRFSHVVAATDNDAYNSLVCTEFGPEFGRSNVFQIGKVRDEKERHALSFTLGGRPLFNPGKDYATLRYNMWEGWVFHSTKISEEFTLDDYRTSRPKETILLLWIKPNGDIVFRHGQQKAEPQPGDQILSFGPKLEDDLSVSGAESKEEEDHQREKAKAKA